MKKNENEKTIKIISKSKTKNPGKEKNSSQRKKTIHESTLSRKDFRENPSVEKLYKTVYDYKLREEAYKTVIEMHLNNLLKEDTKK